MAVAASAVVVTGLTPLVAAQAVSQDCAALLAPVTAASDAQPGYTGRITQTDDVLSGTLSSAWDPTQVRARVSGSIVVNATNGGHPFVAKQEISQYVSQRGLWMAFDGQLISPRVRAGVLSLLGKHDPAFFFTAFRLSPDDVHRSGGVWPSRDVASVLSTPMSVTSATPRSDGGTVYVCAATGRTATFTVNAAGNLAKLTYSGLPLGPLPSGQGLVAATRRAAVAALRSTQHAQPTGTTGTTSIDLGYTYVTPVVLLPSAARTVTLTQIREAIEALHLRSTVRAAADLVLTAAKAQTTHRHHYVSAAELRASAREVTNALNASAIIKLRTGGHPGGVWIAATDPFTGAKVAYSVLLYPSGPKLARVA